MSTINIIVLSVAALIALAIIVFALIVLAVIKHQQKMLKELGITDFSKATDNLLKGKHND